LGFHFWTFIFVQNQKPKIPFKGVKCRSPDILLFSLLGQAQVSLSSFVNLFADENAHSGAFSSAKSNVAMRISNAQRCKETHNSKIFSALKFARKLEKIEIH
jgi:hypothetical protein